MFLGPTAWSVPQLPVAGNGIFVCLPAANTFRHGGGPPERRLLAGFGFIYQQFGFETRTVDDE